MIKPFKYIYSAAIAAVFITMSFSSVNAQDESSDVYLRIYGSLVNNDNNANLNECVVRVLKNDVYLEKYTTKASGKYEFFLPVGSVYRFYYEKDGFVSKNIEIDCVDAAKMDDQFIFSLKADISLFQAIDGMNYDVLKQPIGKGVCNGRKGKVQFDKDYTRNMEEQIASLYVPVEANTSEVQRVTLSEAITEVPEEDDELTVADIFEQAENEQLEIEEVASDNLKKIEEKIPEDANEVVTATLADDNIEVVETETAMEEIVPTAEVAEVVETITTVEETEIIVEDVVEDLEEPKEVIVEEKKMLEPTVVVPSTESKMANNDIVWRVQLGAFTTQNINAFQGLSNIDFITDADGITRCVAGYYETPIEAAKHKLALINKGYSDAFITAYKGDKRMDINDTGINLDHISYTKLKEEINE